jgi:hypothetical protein
MDFLPAALCFPRLSLQQAQKPVRLSFTLSICAQSFQQDYRIVLVRILLAFSKKKKKRKTLDPTLLTPGIRCRSGIQVHLGLLSLFSSPFVRVTATAFTARESNISLIALVVKAAMRSSA